MADQNTPEWAGRLMIAAGILIVLAVLVLGHPTAQPFEWWW